MDLSKTLAVHYDAAFHAKSWDENDAWKNSLNEFVTARMSDRGPATFVPGGDDCGTYNGVFRFSFALGGGDVALKVPGPGVSVAALAAEKSANEAAWIKFLQENTSIPLPKIYSCGTEPGSLSPLDLPYILMDWIPGANLRRFLASSPPKELVSVIYRQLASFYLELHRVPCDSIGSVAQDKATGKWNIRRPLTIDMHQLILGVTNYQTDDWPTGKFTDAKDYLNFVLKQQSKQLWNLLNLNTPCEKSGGGHQPDQPLSSEEIARLRFEAQYRFKQLSSSSQFYPGSDLGPFYAFNPDFDPRNMTVDTTTGKILGVFDLEFTNVMPAQFARDPPLSLFRALPGSALDLGYFPWFLHEYEPLLEQFLDAMQDEELKLGDTLGDQTPLSAMMRDSWVTKRVWFNFGLTHSKHVDAIYWAVLHDLHPGGIAPELPAEVKAEMEIYVQQVGSKLAKYRDSWDSYLEENPR